MIAADTSVVVAAALPSHERHAEAAAVLARGEVRLPTPVLVESYSVLTRLPVPLRVDGTTAREFLSGSFTQPPLALDGEGTAEAVSRLSARGVEGGAIYDGIVAAAARSHDAALVTFDRRALPVYAKAGVEVMFLG